MALTDCCSQLNFVCKTAVKLKSACLDRQEPSLFQTQKCWQTNKGGRGCCHGDAISAPALVDPISCCKQEAQAKTADYGNVADQVHDGNDER